MRSAFVLLALVGSLACAGGANAAEYVTDDGAGRTLRFDVRSESVDPEWFAAILRAAPHRDEIASVRVDVVTRAGLLEVCGRGSVFSAQAACSARAAASGGSRSGTS